VHETQGKSKNDNFRLRLKHLKRLGLLSLTSLIPSRPVAVTTSRVAGSIPSPPGAISTESPGARKGHAGK
jgi:hypothetical protein